MNTILITGTCKNLPEKEKVEYDVRFWASINGEPLQLISQSKESISNIHRLWDIAKSKAITYFGEGYKLNDGAYTNFLQDITPIK